MDYRSLPDNTLITLIERGETAALGELYDRYGRLVYSLALATVGDRTTAEEITQDVFTRVWQKAEQYNSGRAQVNTWISSIARNRSIDALRRRNVRLDQNSVDWNNVAPDAVVASDNPEKETLAILRHQRVRAALQELPEEQRQALALAYFEGLSQREVAKRLDQPLGTIKTRIRLAMQKLRTILSEEMQP